MTIENLLKFKGNANQLEEYDSLLNKADKLKKQIRNLSIKIQDEDDSLSVFNGELNEHDLKLFNKHVSKRKNLYTKFCAKEKLFKAIAAEIQSFQE